MIFLKSRYMRLPKFIRRWLLHKKWATVEATDIKRGPDGKLTCRWVR